jgi:predicted transcriptional regulator
MDIDIDGRKYKIPTEKKLTYQELKDFMGSGICVIPTGEEPAPDKEMKLAIVGINKDVDLFVVELRFKKAHSEQYECVYSFETRAEQLDFFEDEELASFVTLRNKPMDLKKRCLILDMSLPEWLEFIDRTDLIDIMLKTSLGKTISDKEFIAALYKESKPLTLEALAKIIGCSLNVARLHIGELIRIGQVEYCHVSSDGGDLVYVLAQCIRDQLNEEFEILDKKNFGSSDDVTYLSGRLFAVVDRELTKQNGKGMTTQQFEKACSYPFEVFGEILDPVLGNLDEDTEFAVTLSVLDAKIGKTMTGKSRMPTHLNAEGRKLFKQGFEEMYTAMANDEMRRS